MVDVETARNGLLATLNLVAISVVSASFLKVLFLKVQICNLSYKRQKWQRKAQDVFEFPTLQKKDD